MPTCTGSPDCQTMPVRGSTSTSAVVRVQTLGSAQPWGIDTAPGAISSLVRAVPTNSPWALRTCTGWPSAMPWSGWISTSGPTSPKSRSWPFMVRI